MHNAPRILSTVAKIPIAHLLWIERYVKSVLLEVVLRGIRE